jgi:hypothetical protein
MPRYVILRHEVPDGYERPSHWDFMFEDDGALRTWTLLVEPGGDSPIEVEALADHRLAYLEIEGPIGARGSVSRWDEGTFATLVQDDGHWIIELAGRRLCGRVALTRLEPCESTGANQRWTFSFSPAGAEATGLKPGSQVGE